MEERTIVAANPQSAPAPASLFDFGGNLNRAFSFADTLSKSKIIPDTFQGNAAGCLIALDMANRMRRNPLEVMQALYIVHGKPSFSSSFLISLINSCGYYEPLRFRFDGAGDGRSCMAWTVDKRTGETVEGPIVSIQMAKEEGWYGKAGSKWKTMPEVMLRYRAASFFSRAYCPDLTGGFHSVEEARDAGKSEESEHGSPTALEAELRTLKETKQPAVVPAAPAVASTPAPIEPEMLPLDDVPSAPAPAPETKLPVITEVEKLREKLTGALRINYTDAEAEKWLYGHFNRPMKELRVLDLKEAIAAINSELDAKM